MTEKGLADIIKRIEKLEKAVFEENDKPRKPLQKNIDLDLSMNIQAFMTRYAKNKSGGKKFTLMIAHITKGDINKNVEFNEIQKRWNKMKSIIGKFNGFFISDAKNRGLVDSRKYGSYNLTNEWKTVLL